MTPEPTASREAVSVEEKLVDVQTALRMLLAVLEDVPMSKLRRAYVKKAREALERSER